MTLFQAVLKFMSASSRAGPYFRPLLESICEVTKMNRSTKLFGLLKPMWNVHSNKEKSFNSTCQNHWAYLEHLQQRKGTVQLDSSDTLSLSRTFMATRRNRSTRLLGPFACLWNLARPAIRSQQRKLSRFIFVVPYPPTVKSHRYIYTQVYTLYTTLNNESLIV